MYLIIYRLADGRAWQQDTFSTSQDLTTVIYDGHPQTAMSLPDRSAESFRASLSGTAKPFGGDDRAVFVVEKHDVGRLSNRRGNGVPGHSP